MQELKNLIQKTLCENFGEYKLTQAITTAESHADYVDTVNPSKGTI